jgi:hypothetical protein
MDEQFPKYLFEYYHDGAWWNIVIPARSREDAMERINLMPRAKLVGTVEAEIPAGPGVGLLAKLLCSWRNLWFS